MTETNHHPRGPVVCRKCSKINPPEREVCSKCGTPLPTGYTGEFPIPTLRTTPPPASKPPAGAPIHTGSFAVTGQHKIEVVSREESDGTLVIEEQTVEIPLEQIPTQAGDQTDGRTGKTNRPPGHNQNTKGRGPDRGDTSGQDSTSPDSPPKPRNLTRLIMGGVVVAAILCGVTVYTSYNGCPGQSRLRSSRATGGSPWSGRKTRGHIDTTDTGATGQLDGGYPLDMVEPELTGQPAARGRAGAGTDAGTPPEPDGRQPAALDTVKPAGHPAVDQLEPDPRGAGGVQPGLSPLGTPQERAGAPDRERVVDNRALVNPRAGAEAEGEELIDDDDFDEGEEDDPEFLDEDGLPEDPDHMDEEDELEDPDEDRDEEDYDEDGDDDEPGEDHGDELY